VFESFEREPIGCGAIAQVYKAVLRADILPPEYRAPKAHAEPGPALIGGVVSGGDPRQVEVPTTAVALKVLHPSVHKTVARDLKIMHFFASALNLLPGMVWLSLPEEVGVFGEMMNQQLDLRIESANLTRFEANFAHRRGAAVSFPRPVPNFGTRDLLVEEFENGCPLKWFLRNGGAAYDPQLANMGLDAFLVSASPLCETPDTCRPPCADLGLPSLPSRQKMLLLDNFTRMSPPSRARPIATHFS
jgi:aarF domain-containing kinase